VDFFHEGLFSSDTESSCPAEDSPGPSGQRTTDGGSGDNVSCDEYEVDVPPPTSPLPFSSLSLQAVRKEIMVNACRACNPMGCRIATRNLLQ